MEKLEKNVIPLIESVYGELTPVEREVADYFLDEVADRDFSARHVSERLHVSLPSLTRFAKKCGFSGYRQFIYAYQEYEHDKPILNRTLTKQVLQDYGELLKKTYSLIDEAQFLRVGKLLDRAKRVYIYGKGSSGLVAQELKWRFMRLGMICEAMVDEHMIGMNQVLIDSSCLVIGISLSGETSCVIEALKKAKNSQAKTVLLTANNKESLREVCHELIAVAIKDTLSQGRMISPQFPMLLLTDIFYAYYVDLDKEARDAIFQNTLLAFERES